VQQQTALRAIEHTKVQQIVRHELKRLEALQGMNLLKQRHSSSLSCWTAATLIVGVCRWPTTPPISHLRWRGYREDHREGRRNQLRLIEQLMGKGLLEEHMVEEASRLAADTLRAGLTDSVQGRTRRQPLYREELAAGSPEETAPEDDDER
jgi:hypothetical protein